MAYQHIVLLKLNPAVPEESRHTFRTALKKAQDDIGALRGVASVVVGRLQQQKTSSGIEYTHSIVITFADKAAADGYYESDARKALRTAIHDHVVDHISVDSSPYQ